MAVITFKLENKCELFFDKAIQKPVGNCCALSSAGAAVTWDGKAM